MGNINVSHRKDYRRFSLKTPFHMNSSKSSSKKNLSHSFTFMDENAKIEKLNVNNATEEELMTLSGINRQIAQAIVEHRKAIGRFKKIEDLALVSGMGAAKLEQIRPEICVNKSVSHSRSSSVDSLRSYDSRNNLKYYKLINVNKATVFELQCVNGITQEMAAAIVHYRNKKGYFKTLDDLIYVKTIDKIKLSNIRQYLTVVDNNSDVELEKSLTNGFVNGYHINGTATNNKLKNGTNPIKLNLNNGLNLTSIHNIYELLSAYSHRPILEEKFKYKRNGVDAIRFATWNLQNFTEEKANNYGVKEVVCLTILENKWSVVVLQEIIEPKALMIICDDLNSSKIQRISDVRDNSKNWNFCMLDSTLGFLYDKSNTSITTELDSLNEVNFKDVEALVATFNINNKFTMTLVNVHLSNELSYDEASFIVKETVINDNPYVVLGDFSTVSAQNMDQRKELGGLQTVIPLGTSTGYTTGKIKCCDNILVNHLVQKRLTGNWGLVKEGLTHLAIPNGWSWGGATSAHCPLWIEIYINDPPL